MGIGVWPWDEGYERERESGWGSWDEKKKEERGERK